MKRINYILLFLLIGCSEYEYPETVVLNVQINVPEEFVDQISLSGVEVQIENKQTKRKHSAISNEKGIAKFEVRGGIYDIISSKTGTGNIKYYKQIQDKKYRFYAALRNVRVLEKASCVLELKYNLPPDDFIFKELYTSGSRTVEGKLYYRDSFIEIYNNTDSTLFADGVCIGVVSETTTSKPTKYTDSAGNLLDRIPIYSFIAIIPGNGTDHPIKPRASVLIASSGIDHKNKEKANPNSIDLSHADWELYVDYHKNIDSPKVPNMLMHNITPYNNFMAFDTRGQVCILFRIPGNNYAEYLSDENNYYKHPERRYPVFMVPRAWVIDGVDNLMAGETVYKRLPESIDIGYIQHAGPGKKVSICRKTAHETDGRIVYQDTNNSSVDFETNQEPTPGVFAKKE